MSYVDRLLAIASRSYRLLLAALPALSLIHCVDASAAHGAAFVSQNVPAQMVAGERYQVSVTMRNTGTTTWTNVTGAGTPNSYSLGTQNPQDNFNWSAIGSSFPNRVPVAASVPPGGAATFLFTVVAPAKAGTYNFQWRMVQDFVTWFGDLTANVQVRVVTAQITTFLPDAAFVSQSVPTAMIAGQTYPVSIDIRNTGNTTWLNTTGPGTPNAYSLGSQNPQDNATWGLGPGAYPGRIPVTGSVPPGAVGTFSFRVTAPATPGTYNFQWQMVDDFVTWFGNRTPNVSVIVSADAVFAPNAKFVAQSVPMAMTAGERYPVSITMQNTGNTVWRNVSGAATPGAYSLGTQNPQDSTQWGALASDFPHRVPVAADVQPGAIATFGFTVAAPERPGLYDFQWQMVDDYIAWFGDRTPNVQVVVAPPIDFKPGTIGFAAPLAFGQPIIGDVNGDGWLEPIGTVNDGTGRLTTLGLQAMGIQGLFSESRPDDVRLADLDGDRCPDLIAQGYSAYSATTNVGSRALLYFNNGKGQFTEDPAFGALNLTGRGEGAVVADFNNDGASDLYLPYYTFGASVPCMPAEYCPNSPQSYLLLNDGTGHFTPGDVPGTVDLATVPGGQPEGVQAADVNDDGRIDLYVAGRLFLNLGAGPDGRVSFADCNCGVPRSPNGLLVDEGAKFLDWDNDGKLDLILHDAYAGPALYHNVGTPAKPRFERRAVRGDGMGPQFAAKIAAGSRTTYGGLQYCASYGMNVYDLDSDGFEDVVVAGSIAPQAPGCDYPNVVFRNTGAGFESVSAGAISGWDAGGVLAFGDINHDGRIDTMYVGPYPYYFVNAAVTSANGSFTVEVLGPLGEQNQHGRVVRVGLPKPGCTASQEAGCTLSRVVDGGSGYHSQNQYPVLIGTPYQQRHHVAVIFPHPAMPGATVTVAGDVAHGQYARIFAPSLQSPTGRFVVFDRLPDPVSCVAR